MRGDQVGAYGLACKYADAGLKTNTIATLLVQTIESVREIGKHEALVGLIDGPRGSLFSSESLLQENIPFQPTFQAHQGLIQSCPVFDTTLTDQQARDLIHTAQSHARSNIMFGPKVTLFTGQKASIQDLTQKPFVTNMRPADDIGSEMEPVVEMVGEGIQIEIIADVTEKMEVELQAVVNLSQIQKVELANLPFASAENPKASVTVQVPSVNRTVIRSNVRLSDGQSLLIAVPQAFSADESARNNPSVATLILLTTRIIPYLPEVAE